ncbi:MAG: metal-dependent hydrolase [Verrucomicrobiae bacterium]|nr:metal-dependent hydrolase [Verrucomicrobiae bacterium]
MDNVTHAALGLSAGLLVARRGGSLPAAAVAALLAAEAPDLDVFIRNGDDPLVSFRWHRHFTHSFIFMPIWAVLSALLTSWLFRWRQKGEEPWRGLFLPAFAGVLTHLLCDGCTSYGTMLLWPFDEARYAWDCLPIVDLFATLPLLTLAILAYRRQSRRKKPCPGIRPRTPRLDGISRTSPNSPKAGTPTPPLSRAWSSGMFALACSPRAGGRYGRSTSDATPSMAPTIPPWRS